MQSVLGTAVGVGFIFPVVVQILGERSVKLINRTELLLADLKRNQDRTSILDIANLLTTFRRELDVSERRANWLIGVSSISALAAYLLLIWAQFQPKICLSLLVGASSTFVISAPIGASVYYFLRWYDTSRPLAARYWHYYNQ